MSRLKLILTLICVLLFIITFNYVKDLRAKNRLLISENSILSEKFSKISDAYKEQGVVYATERKAWEDASKALGSDFINQLKGSDAKIRVLHEVIASLDQDIRSGSIKVTTSNSGFSQTLRQDRGSAPPLTEVALTYNQDLKKLNYTWTNFKEVYKFSLGEWVKKDNGYVSGVRVQRSILGPNAEPLGTEELPLVSAEARYNPEVITPDKSISVPRWTLYGGPGWDLTKHRAVPVLGVDYRFTPKLGISTGLAGSIIYTNVSWRVGK